MPNASPNGPRIVSNVSLTLDCRCVVEFSGNLDSFLAANLLKISFLPDRTEFPHTLSHSASSCMPTRHAFHRSAPKRVTRLLVDVLICLSGFGTVKGSGVVVSLVGFPL